MNQDQIDEMAAVLSMTSDRVIEAWNRVTHGIAPIVLGLNATMTRFYRSLYYAGIVNIPPSNHPMTARKMRGAIRRLKAGEIGVSTED